MPTIGFIECNGSGRNADILRKVVAGLRRHTSQLAVTGIGCLRVTPKTPDANPFDPLWDDYFDKRRMKRLRDTYAHKRNMKNLLRKSGGLCLLCKQPITIETGLHVHHLEAQALGGTDDEANLSLVHPVCHLQWHVHNPVKAAGE